jgi:hypothetical protein
LIGKSEKNILRRTEGGKGGRSFNRLATKTWYGKPVKGLGSSEKENSWNYATTK